MIDAGAGHGPVDFEAMQIRVLRKGEDATQLLPLKPAVQGRSFDDNHVVGLLAAR
jgi:hypothetical protein